MSSKRFTEEFHIEAVKQVTERGYPVKEVSERLGVSTWSLYNWIKDYSTPPEIRQADEDQVALQLNERPRKTLGFDTPAARLAAYVASTG